VTEEQDVEPWKQQLSAAGMTVWVEKLNVPAEATKVKNPRESAAFTYGYNSPAIAGYAQQVSNALGRLSGPGERKFVLIGLGRAGSAAAAAAAAMSDNKVQALVVDTGGFRFQKMNDIRDPLLFPAGAKYGDLPGLLALGAPRKLYLTGEGTIAPDLITAAYETAGVRDTLRVTESRDLSAIISWLRDALN
jgi:hypothetical protein